MAIIKDSNFLNGIIEYDVAFSEERGFMGAVWRLQDNLNYEEFYMRPHQSGKPDANQYTPVFSGLSGWQLYHGESYGAPFVYPYNEWIHVKIVISGSMGEVYINNMTKPILFISELKRDIKPGKVGIHVSNFAPAYYSNFSFKNVDKPELLGTPGKKLKTPVGTVTSWLVSNTFDEKSFERKYYLTDVDKENLSWESLKAEQTGITNLARISKIGENNNTVFVKVIVKSDKEHVKKFRFGYSDRVKLYFNNKLIYSGNNLYRSRDFRYLGTIGLFDEVYLPMKKGENEIWMAISESFGGWGVIGLFENLEGIKVEYY